jgi:hypothetical protein
MRSRASVLVTLTVLTYSAPVLAQVTDQASEGATPIWQTILVYWGPFVAFVALWAWIYRRMYSKTPGGYAGYLRRALEHMDRVEQKLDRILEQLERPKG